MKVRTLLTEFASSRNMNPLLAETWYIMDRQKSIPEAKVIRNNLLVRTNNISGSNGNASTVPRTLGENASVIIS